MKEQFEDLTSRIFLFDLPDLDRKTERKEEMQYNV
jgi:hypothetical protein